MTDKRTSIFTEHDIGLAYLKNVDTSEIKILESEISKRLSPKVKSEEYSPPLQAADDWILPAMIYLIFAKPFLDGLMEELGAQTGKSLKNVFARLIKKQENNEAVWMNRIGLEKAIEQLDEGVKKENLNLQGKTSPILSFLLTFSEDHKVRIVLPHSVTKFSQKNIEQVISEISNIIQVEKGLDKYLRKKRIVLYGYDTEENAWILDPTRYQAIKNNKLQK